MANITISNLQSTGSDLFLDSENYLNELSEEELNIQGGYWIITATIVISLLADSW